MRKYAITKGDAADDEERGFSEDGDSTILTSDFIIGIVDTGVFIDATMESPYDLFEMIECLFAAGEEVIGRINPSIDKPGIFSLLCLAHAERVMRSLVIRRIESVDDDMIALYHRLKRLLEETDVDSYMDRCINEISEEGE